MDAIDGFTKFSGCNSSLASRDERDQEHSNILLKHPYLFRLVGKREVAKLTN